MNDAEKINSIGIDDYFEELERREAAEKALREREKRLDADLTGVMSTKSGRRAMAFVLNVSGFAESCSHADQHLMAIASGRRDVGIEISRRLEAICPELYDLMRKEQREDGRTDDDCRDL